MDIVDRDLENAERDASPQLFGENEPKEIFPPIRRNTESYSGLSSGAQDERHMSRIPTGENLDRHPTELSRINTQRSQHTGTVGSSLKSRKSLKPLPNFGAGKPYPPPLPAQEGYVVEFDGPNDPLHAMNW